LNSTAGPTSVVPWKNLNEETFRVGGRKNDGTDQPGIDRSASHQSKRIIYADSGALTDDPQKDFANASAANVAVEGFVRGPAIGLENGIRINAVSPTVIEASPQYFPFFSGEFLNHEAA
jgi:NAD(P)-dependent dehydrogenase (short-subunit alcohol dehydrogenase family)